MDNEQAEKQVYKIKVSKIEEKEDDFLKTVQPVKKEGYFINPEYVL